MSSEAIGILNYLETAFEGQKNLLNASLAKQELKWQDSNTEVINKLHEVIESQGMIEVQLKESKKKAKGIKDDVLELKKKIPVLEKDFQDYFNDKIFDAKHNKSVLRGMKQEIKDKFENTGGSRIINKIKLQNGWSDTRVHQELENRKKILQWMMKTDLRSYEAVGRVVSEYAKDPDAVLKKVKEDN